MTVGQCFEKDAEGDKAAKYPNIRLFTVKPNASNVPLDDLAKPQQPWSVSAREVSIECCVCVCVGGLFHVWVIYYV